ncbi:MAG: hypothetical protein SF187_09305 [Deltaproteobacteria bacterium]|nr:hypothetical protein [Deltaproteobacteria bacterium]
MITAALSAAVVGALSLLGVRLSAVQVTGVVVAMKVCVVLGVLAIGYRVKRKRAAEAPAPSTDATSQ